MSMFKEVKYTVRHNLGNYEHEEITLTAAVPEGAFINDVMSEVKVTANRIFMFNSQTPVVSQVPVVEKVEAPVEQKPAKEPKAPKATKAAKETPASKEDIIDGVEVPPVIPADAIPPKEEMESVESPFKKAPKGVVLYDATIKDHRDRLAAYLNKEFPTWKTKPKETLTAFSKSLVGKEFEDSKGVMLASFTESLGTFFA